MKNDTICVNLCMEKGQINHWLSMLYSVEKHGFTNDNLKSMINGLCEMDNLNYSDEVDESRVVEIIPIAPIIVESPHKIRMRQRDRAFLFDLASKIWQKDRLDSLYLRKSTENEMRKICDRHGFDVKEFFDFDSLPPIKEFVPKPFIRSQSPPVVIASRNISPVAVKIAKPVIVPEIEVLEGEIKESPYFPEGSEIPHCPDCHKPVDGSNNNRFKTSSVVGYKVCNKCYQSHYQLNKQRQYDAVFQ